MLLFLGRWQINAWLRLGMLQIRRSLLMLSGLALALSAIFETTRRASASIFSLGIQISLKVIVQFQPFLLFL